MKTSLVNVLRCPATGDALTLTDATPGNGADVVSGRLVTATGRTYNVVDGVPIMLLPETFAAGQAETRESFSEKWRLAPDYREATKPHYVQWYLERYGFETAGRPAEVSWRGSGSSSRRARVRAGTAGCLRGELEGHGIRHRHQQGHLRRLSRPEGDLPNLNLVQADIGQAAVRRASSSTSSPATRSSTTRRTPGASLRQLARVPERGAGTSPSTSTRRRARSGSSATTTCGRPRRRCREEECMTASAEADHQARQGAGGPTGDGRTSPEDIPLLGIKAGHQDVQRFIYWNVFKCYWNDDVGLRHQRDHQLRLVSSARTPTGYTEDEVRAMV